MTEAVISGRLDSLDLALPLVPFPKEAGRVRHFVRPTLDAEFATLLLGVLLCPLLEARMWSFSFGGRWYSGMAKLPEEDPKAESRQGWAYRLLPFSLADEQLFSSYRRSYGLLRRVTHWTTLSMLGEEPASHQDGGARARPEEYAKAQLPYLSLRKRLAPTASGASASVHHIRMDLASAYPSVRRKELRVRLLALLRKPLDVRLEQMRIAWELPAPPIDRWPYPFRPRDVWSQLDDAPRIRDLLANRWLDLLDEMHYVDPGEVGDVWLPKQTPKKWPALPGLGTQSEGLPTGLSVASVWFNVYLAPLDERMATHIGLTGSDPKPLKGAFFRYVDDMFFLGHTIESTLGLFGEVMDWLKETAPTTNMQPSYGKLKPALLMHGLKARRAASPNLRKLSTDWRDRAKAAWAAAPCVHRVDATDLGHFVTTLVEQMSDLGNPGILDIWGHEIGPRLTELHRLIRVETGDKEVREDTRLAFAGRRISVAPVPLGAGGDEGRTTDTSENSSLDEIQRSVRLALRRAPWKLSLLDAAMRLAFRLLADGNGGQERAQRWIEELGLLLGKQGPLHQGRPWGPCLDSADTNVADALTSRGMTLALSMLRAQARHALASLARELRFIARLDVMGTPRWGASHWTAPLMTLDAFMEAVGRLKPLGDALESALSGAGATRILPFWEEAALRDLELALDPGDPPDPKLPRETFLLWLAECPMPPAHAIAAIRLRDDLSIEDRVSLSVQHGLQEWLSQNEILRLGTTFVRPPEILDDTFSMEKYRRLRHMQMAVLGPQSVPDDALFEVAELLWTPPAADDLEFFPYERSAPSLAETPAIGLPPAIVESLLRAALKDKSRRAWTAVFVNSQVAKRLEKVRLWQLEGEPHLAPSWPTEPYQNWLTQPGLVQRRTSLWPAHPLIQLLTEGSRSHPSTRYVPMPWHLPLLLYGLMLAAGDDNPLNLLLSSYPEPPSVSLRRSLRDAYPLSDEFWHVWRRAYDGEQKELKSPLPIEEGYQVISVRVPLDATAIEILAFSSKEERAASRQDGFLPTMRVRLAQLDQLPWNNLSDVVDHWPAPPEPGRMLRRVAQALPFRAQGDHTSELPRLTILPELTLPWEAAHYLAATARRYGFGLLTGTWWRPIPAVVPAGWCKQRRFANEALLVLPIERDRQGGVTGVWRIRKPRPAANELGLAKALSLRQNVEWRMLPGDRFYRFEHSLWGDFTVGICSDILDPTPWAALRGRVMHMFFSAMNEDVDLFNSITRTRAYENYCNVVLVNHGSKGGSFAWSPRSGNAKEIARFHGGSIEIVADVGLPVKGLFRAQRSQLEDAIAHSAKTWVAQPEQEDDRYKTPPPGYRRKFS